MKPVSLFLFDPLPHMGQTYLCPSQLVFPLGARSSVTKSVIGLLLILSLICFRSSLVICTRSPFVIQWGQVAPVLLVVVVSVALLLFGRGQKRRFIIIPKLGR
jgi:hypothetical protein